MNINKLNWDFSNPHTLSFTVKETDIDLLGHVNNKVYLSWCETVSWDHSKKLGITPNTYLDLKCACVVIKSENNFKGSLYIDDNIEISTWIIDTDQKIKLSRYFQIINISNNQTVFTSHVDYACISLNNFKPVRMPELFRKKYVITTNA